MTLTPPSSSLAVAAGTIDATKVYGSGDSEVRALDGVTVQFQGSGDGHQGERVRRTVANFQVMAVLGQMVGWQLDGGNQLIIGQ